MPNQVYLLIIIERIGAGVEIIVFDMVEKDQAIRKFYEAAERCFDDDQDPPWSQDLYICGDGFEFYEEGPDEIVKLVVQDVTLGEL